jgi:hypothetical protein
MTAFAISVNAGRQSEPNTTLFRFPLVPPRSASFTVAIDRRRAPRSTATFDPADFVGSVTYSATIGSVLRTGGMLA